jgi:type IV secretory pathway VirB10-like protein
LIEEQEDPRRASLLDRLRARFAPGAQSRELKSSERTRGLVILAGASLACLFLFFGLFTTDAGSAKKARGTSPNLGRPANAEANPETSVRSPVPQLSVNQQPYEEPNELTEQDVLGTMRNRGAAAAPQAPPARDLASADFSDPALAEAYRRQNLVPPPRPAPVTNWGEAIAGHQGRPQQAAPPVPVEDLRKPSLVYVRSQTVAPQARPAIERVQRSLLPQGTALIARLQHGVSSAAKAPVIAVVEYNYEDDGVIVVPAGTKACGELTGATPQGWVTLKFHTLEFPNGATEEIDGSALGMQRQALRGEVSGQNHAKRFLTRALTGVGTIAAFAVGGRGMSGGIDNSILLRERVASNVALAGEQEMARLAYQQNIVVTVPANTRFYLVLHQSGGERALTHSVPTQPRVGTLHPTQAAGQADLSLEELRELTQLRDEVRELTRLVQPIGRQDVAPRFQRP